MKEQSAPAPTPTSMTKEQEEAVRRKLAEHEFDDMFIRSKQAKKEQLATSIKIGIEGSALMPPKTPSSYAPEEKVLYIDLLTTCRYLQAMRQSMAEKQWLEIVNDQVRIKNLTKEHAAIIKSSKRIKVSRTEWYALHHPVPIAATKKLSFC